MKHLILNAVFFFMLSQNAALAQIPDWVKDEFSRLEGTWSTDNSQYMNENETDDSYALTWKFGVGNASMIGVLYGIKDGAKTNEYWQFYQYWDAEADALRVIQTNGFGTTGNGLMPPGVGNVLELEQLYVNPDGSTFRIAHTTIIHEDYDVTKSYHISDSGEKELGRVYQWYKN